MRTVRGTFEVEIHPEPHFAETDGIALGRLTVDKRFAGALEGTSKVYMTTAGRIGMAAGVYVAVEVVTGTLEGRSGVFALAHLGVRDQGSQSLTVVVVPGSGAGELEGISGRLNIQVEGGQHFYELEYTLPEDD